MGVGRGGGTSPGFIQAAAVVLLLINLPLDGRPRPRLVVDAFVAVGRSIRRRPPCRFSFALRRLPSSCCHPLSEQERTTVWKCARLCPGFPAVADAVLEERLAGEASGAEESIDRGGSPPGILRALSLLRSALSAIDSRGSTTITIAPARQLELSIRSRRRVSESSVIDVVRRSGVSDPFLRAAVAYGALLMGTPASGPTVDEGRRRFGETEDRARMVWDAAVGITRTRAWKEVLRKREATVSLPLSPSCSPSLWDDERETEDMEDTGLVVPTTVEGGRVGGVTAEEVEETKERMKVGAFSDVATPTTDAAVAVGATADIASSPPSRDDSSGADGYKPNGQPSAEVEQGPNGDAGEGSGGLGGTGRIVDAEVIAPQADIMSPRRFSPAIAATILPEAPKPRPIVFVPPDLTPAEAADRAEAVRIAMEYEPTEFLPPDGALWRDRHVQTLAGAFLRDDGSDKGGGGGGGQILGGLADGEVGRWLSSTFASATGVGRWLARSAGWEPSEPLGASAERALLGREGVRDGKEGITNLSAVASMASAASGGGDNAIAVPGLIRPSNQFYDTRRRFGTPDGNFFDVDYVFAANHRPMSSGSIAGLGSTSKGLVVMTHGLESSSSSPLNVDAARAFLRRGYDVAAVNFRGCSGGGGGGGEAGGAGTGTEKWGQYHLGFTDDLRQFVEGLNRQESNFWNYGVVGKRRLRRELDGEKGEEEEEVGEGIPVFLCGFSLGANVVLKLLGELGPDAKKLNICGAAVANAPFDCYANRFELAKPGINRLLYTTNLLHSLKKKVRNQLEEQRRRSDDDDKPTGAQTETVERASEVLPFDPVRVLSSSTINDFDDAFVAPVFGFTDKDDYYNRTSSTQFLDGICVPTMVINSRNDPFLNSDTYPEEKNDVPVRLVYTAHGGHLGFMFHEPRAGTMFRTAMEGELEGGRVTWMPSELARFIDHVDERRRDWLEKENAR